MHSLLEKLRPNQRKGSKPRCHWMTHGQSEQVAGRLKALAEPWGCVSSDDHWMPRGFCQIEESQLHKSPKLLSQQDCEALGRWWLKEPSDDSRTPNWDIASTCTVDGQKGLLLVEAKAHTLELKAEDEVKGSPTNRKRIAERIGEANAALKDQTGLCWALSHEHHYQMSNRFAWAWKLADLGYPVVLVYLGFLGAEEMRKGTEQTPFKSQTEWQALVKAHSKPLFPTRVWESKWDVHDCPVIPRICSVGEEVVRSWQVGTEGSCC